MRDDSTISLVNIVGKLYAGSLHPLAIVPTTLTLDGVQSFDPWKFS